MDYLISSAPCSRKITNFHILDLDPCTDHCPITFEINQSLNQSNFKKSKNADRPSHYKWNNYMKIDYQNYLKDEISDNILSSLICDLADNTCDINTHVANLNQCVNYAASHTMRKNKKFRGNFPCNTWYDAECKQLKADLRIQARLINHCDKEHRIDYHKNKRIYKNLIQRKKRQHQKKVACELETLQSNDPQAYWKFWKRQKRNISPVDYINVDVFTQHYIEQNNIDSNIDCDTKFITIVKEFINNIDDSYVVTVNEPLNDILNAPINIDELNNALKRTKINKAPGPDGFPSELYKYNGGSLNKYLIAIFNKVFESGQYPTQWCEGIINPIHKKNEKADPDN